MSEIMKMKHWSTQCRTKTSWDAKISKSYFLCCHFFRSVYFYSWFAMHITIFRGFWNKATKNNKYNYINMYISDTTVLDGNNIVRNAIRLTIYHSHIHIILSFACLFKNHNYECFLISVLRIITMTYTN